MDRQIAQNTHLANHHPYMTNVANFQNLETQLQQKPTNRFDSSLVDLFNQQQALQKYSSNVISKVSDLQTQNKKLPFLGRCASI